MNLNDKRIQAYKKTAQHSAEPKGGSGGAAGFTEKAAQSAESGSAHSFELEPNLTAANSASVRGGDSEKTTVKKMRTHIDALMERDGLLKIVKAQNLNSENKTDGLSAANGENTANGGPTGDSVYRRVAKFLLLIGVNEAAKILPHLTDEQTEKIIPEIASVRSVDPDEASAIFAEFQSLLQRSRQSGGVQTARTILEKAFGPEKAQHMLEKSVPYPEGTPFDYLQEIDTDRLEQLLKDEIAPVQALVLSRLKPALAADFIKRQNPQKQKEIISRLAKLSSLPPDIVRRIDGTMREKLQTLSTEATDRIDGRNALAGILKKMNADAEKNVLSLLGQTDPELEDDLRRRLFTVDDIVNADDRFMQEKLRSMSDEEIAVLIAGKEECFRQKILTNVSKTRGDIILEEEQLKKPVLKKDSDEITNAFFTFLRRAWEDGKLVVKDRGEDVYV